MVITIYCKCIQGNKILSILYRCLLYPTNILYISSLRGLFILVYICMKFYLFSKKEMCIVKKKFEDTKYDKSKDRQYHGNQKKDKRWSTTHYTETKDWETRTPEKNIIFDTFLKFVQSIDWSKSTIYFVNRNIVYSIV
jgi:hypothetical protein